MMIRDRLLRYRVMELHTQMIRTGEYHAARKVLRCLNDGYVRLGLDDDSWKVETELEKLGCRMWYSGNGNRATAYCLYDNRRRVRA